jgi:hypothetical protein
VIAGVVTYVVWPGERTLSFPTVPSTALPPGRVDVAQRVPMSYRVVYRDDVSSGGEVTSSTDEVLVRRPFDASVTTRLPTGQKTSTVFAFSRYSVRGQVLNLPPGHPDPDLRPDASIREAISDGYATQRGRRRVAGRVCRVFRVDADPRASSLPRVHADATTYTDVCVDEAGLALQEDSYDGGDLVTRRVALRVDERPEIEARAFDLPRSHLDPSQAGSIRTLEPDSRMPGGTFWELASEPDGFTALGRFAVVPPGQSGFTDPTQRGSITVFVSEVWTRGPDVFVVEQGATQGGTPFERDPNARSVSIPGVGTGELRYSLGSSEVRIRTSAVRFVRIRGTLPPSRLLALARSLEPKPGGPLRVKP